MPIQHIADTALITAFARATESARAHALFKDPLAAAMAGDRGAQLAAETAAFQTIVDAVGCRTTVIDELLERTLDQTRATAALNLAAGLDCRAFRLSLPDSLKWVDVDSAPVLDYKSQCLGEAPPRCDYEQVTADLANSAEVAAVVEHLANSPRVVVLTEGLLVYLSESQVSQLARYLFSGVNVRAWITDLAGPQALWMMARAWGDLFRGARFQFGPANPKEFFAECGWRETEFRSSQEEAQRLGRAPNRGLMNRMVLSAAPARAREELRRLSGVSVLERIDAPVVGSRSAAYPNEDLSSHRGSLLRLAGRL